MTPAELKPIVETWGGVDKLAAILDVKPRTVESWQRGERGIKPPIAKLIRSLEPKRNRKKNSMSKSMNLIPIPFTFNGA